MVSRLTSTLIKRDPTWGDDTYTSTENPLPKSPDPPSEGLSLKGLDGPSWRLLEFRLWVLRFSALLGDKARSIPSIILGGLVRLKVYPLMGPSA